MPEVSLHLLTNQEFDGLSEGTRRSLALQGFSGENGQLGVITHPDVTFFLGIGRSMTPRAVTQAMPRALSQVARGSTVSVRGNVSAVIGLVNILLNSADLSPKILSDRERIVSLALSRARMWTNSSGAELNPNAFVDVASTVATENNLAINVRRLEDLVSGGFGGIVSVGQASRYEPCLIDLRYTPEAPRTRVTLVGKGVTFDTGGLSMKRPDQMMGMRMDKAGAAAVLSAISAVASLQLPVEVRALLPIAENMVGPSATRPGDNVKSRSGTTIQILDTDFEGRVLMADAISFAAEENPGLIIDIATLTYQVAIALGDEIAGLFSNSDELAQKLLDAGSEVGEAAWRLPLAEEYRRHVATKTGVKNHPESDTGRAITAALFLQEFIPEGVEWVHLDCTGPAWVGPPSAEGATGYGVLTLIRFLEQLSSS